MEIRDAQEPSVPPDSERESWEPWADGEPQLRTNSFTAKQLCYLTPQAMHLESRRVLIGDFPDGWVERNCQPWFTAVNSATHEPETESKPPLAPAATLKRTSSQTSVETTQETLQQTAPQPARIESLDPAMAESRVPPREMSATTLLGTQHSRSEAFSTAPSTHDSSPHGSRRGSQCRHHDKHRHRHLPKVERLSDSMRAAHDVELVERITEASHMSAEKLAARRERMVKRLRRRRAMFRHQRLDEAPQQVVGLPPVSPQSTVSSDRTRVSDPGDSTSVRTDATASQQSVYYDCQEGPEPPAKAPKPAVSITSNPPDVINISSDKAMLSEEEEEEAREAGQRDPKDEAPEGVGFSQSLDNRREDRPPPDAARSAQLSAQVSFQDAGETPSIASHSIDQISYRSKPLSSRFSDLRRKAQARLTTHRTRQIVYQGRFLVQIREAHSANPVISEPEAPLATSLAARWREYAVFAKYTGKPHRPLCLYFYDAIKDSKLTRRSRRVWSRSLDFKVTLDPRYELKVFSPLDMTVALWRPYSNPGHRKKTKVLIVHSQSINGIWDLSFLLSSIAHASELFTPRVMNIGVPSIGVEVQLLVKAATYRENEDLQRATMSYKELCVPLVSASPILGTLMHRVWDAVKSLPRRYSVSTSDREAKYALAWQQGSTSHRQLWVPGSANELHVLSRLFWLMQPCGNLHLISTEPRCYEGDLIEPPGAEGFCTSIEAGSVVKRLPFRRTYGKQYLYTNDHYLFYTQGVRVEPPMLASGQNSVVKAVEPFVLDSQGDIKWIKQSTCLKEVDFHDSMARLELERRINMISQARGMIDLRRADSIEADGSVEGELSIKVEGSSRYKLRFESQLEAESWQKHLSELGKYWRAVHTSISIRRATSNHKSIGITPFLKNRPVLLSGPVFLKKHRFQTFKRFFVILTMHGLNVFEIDESERRPMDANTLISATSYAFRRTDLHSLADSYVYTGQLAKHALLDDDKHIDPSNPGVRALPRAYDDGWVSQDTELDRCFVVWQPRRSGMSRLFNSKGSGSYITFLARDKHERDHWVTAIRYVQTELVSKSKEDIVSSDFNDSNTVDIGLASKL